MVEEDRRTDDCNDKLQKQILRLRRRMTTKRQLQLQLQSFGGRSWWGGLFAGVGGFEVAVGGVGLGLVAASGRGEFVLLYGFVALVKEVEHFSGVELGATAQPIAAGGLSGGEEVVLCCSRDVVLAAFCIGQTPVGHVQAGFDEVAGFLRVGEDLAVDGDGAGTVAGVLGEVGDLDAEEEVARVLVGEAFLNDDGLGIAAVVAQEERERGAGLDWRDDAVGGGFAEEIEAFLLVAGDAGDADHDAEDEGKAGDGELLEADGHFCVGVTGVDLEGLFAVAAGGEALAGGGDVTVFGEGDESGVHAASVSAGEIGVCVVGVRLDLLVAEGDGGVGEGLDARADVGGHGDAALGGEEGVVGVVGGVEEILTVEFAKDERLEDVAGGNGGLRIGLLDGFEAGEGAVVVEVVEVLVGLADLGGEVDGVGVGGGMVGVRESWERQQECKKKEAEDFYAAFYCSSPKPEPIGVVESISLRIRMIV